MWVFWALFGVIAIVLILWMVKIERARLGTHVARCKAAAEKMGVSYESRASEGLVVKLRGFDLTYADGAMLIQRIRDIFSRRTARDETHVFLHEYRSSSPHSGGATRRETAACVTSPSQRLPRFRLSPERRIEKAAAAAGMRDIDFDSHPGFSSAYFLNGEDEAATRALFDREALDFFEAHSGLYVEGNGDTLLVYRPGKTLELEGLPGFFRSVDDIARLFR